MKKYFELLMIIVCGVTAIYATVVGEHLFALALAANTVAWTAIAQAGYTEWKVKQVPKMLNSALNELLTKREFNDTVKKLKDVLEMMDDEICKLQQEREENGTDT